MTDKPQSALLSPLQTARALAAEFAQTAVERDERGGTPKAQRDALRQSGLLALSIPAQYGGLGAGWSETLNIVREFAKVDSSIAHVFGFHHLMLATVRLFSRPEQMIVPTLPSGNAARDAPRHIKADAERPMRHSHAERGNDQTSPAGASFPARKVSAPASDS